MRKHDLVILKLEGCGVCSSLFSYTKNYLERILVIYATELVNMY
jgi:hypothetical protein